MSVSRKQNADLAQLGRIGVGRGKKEEKKERCG